MIVCQPSENFNSLNKLILQLQLSLELTQIQELLTTYTDLFIFLAQYAFLYETTNREIPPITQDPARDGGNWYGYCGNNPLCCIDSDGFHSISFAIYRGKETRMSTTDYSKRGQDIIQFINNNTGETFTMRDSQTVVSNSDYEGDNTISAYDGNISIRYLGNNTEYGQTLNNGEGSNYYGPVFDVKASIENGHETDSYGIDSKSNDITPYRMHSNYSMKPTPAGEEKGVVPMASGGCPMYDYNYANGLAEFLESGGVKPGDSISGGIKEDVGP